MERIENDELIDLGEATELTQGSGASILPDEQTGQRVAFGLSDD